MICDDLRNLIKWSPGRRLHTACRASAPLWRLGLSDAYSA